MRYHGALAGVLAFSAGLLSAQQAPDSVPPPPFPIKLRAPEKSSWTVTFEIKATGSNNEKGSQGAAVSVTKTDKIYVEEAVDNYGKSWKRWIFGTGNAAYTLVQYTGSNKWERVWLDIYDTFPRYDVTDFENFQWISRDNYKGVEMLDGKPVYAFVASGPTPLTRSNFQSLDQGRISKGEAPTFHARAWLDAETLLPIKLESDRMVETYQFGQPPTDRLKPPSEVLVALEQWVRDMKRVNR